MFKVMLIVVSEYPQLNRSDARLLIFCLIVDFYCQGIRPTNKSIPVDDGLIGVAEERR